MNNRTPESSQYEAGLLAIGERKKTAERALALVETLRISFDHPDLSLESNNADALFDQVKEDISDLYFTIRGLESQLLNKTENG